MQGRTYGGGAMEGHVPHGKCWHIVFCDQNLFTYLDNI